MAIAIYGGSFDPPHIGHYKIASQALKTLELDVMIPKKQLCCGAPAYFTGDFDTVDYLVKKNIEYFESFIDEIDAIIVPEATCSAMIKIDYPYFFHNQEEWKKRAELLNQKIFLATEWLYKQTELKTILKQIGSTSSKTVTYHDPCHAKKMQGVFKEPRELIKHNYLFKEMEDSNQCCGFGGITMQTEKYDLAKKVGDKKAEMIKNTKAEIVSAECSACRMQITNALYQNHSEVIFRNPLELIAKALNFTTKASR